MQGVGRNFLFRRGCLEVFRTHRPAESQARSLRERGLDGGFGSGLCLAAAIGRESGNGFSRVHSISHSPGSVFWAGPPLLVDKPKGNQQGIHGHFRGPLLYDAPT